MRHRMAAGAMAALAMWLAAGSLAPAGALAAGSPAAGSLGAAQPPIPSEGWEFAIRLDDGVETAAPGDTVTYRVELRNTGRADATADVELTLPVGAEVVAVEHGQSPEPWFAKWTLSVPAGGTATVSATFRAGQPAPEAKGHAATACLVRDHTRLICATDIDQLPGAADVHAIGGADDRAVPGRARLLLGAATLLLLAVAVALWRRWPAARFTSLT